MSCITSFCNIHNFLLSFNIYCFHLHIVAYLCTILYSQIIPFSFPFIGIILFSIFIIHFSYIVYYHIVFHDFTLFKQLNIINFEFYLIQNVLTLSLEYVILPHKSFPLYHSEIHYNQILYWYLLIYIYIIRYYVHNAIYISIENYSLRKHWYLIYYYHNHIIIYNLYIHFSSWNFLLLIAIKLWRVDWRVIWTMWNISHLIILILFIQN